MENITKYRGLEVGHYYSSGSWIMDNDVKLVEPTDKEGFIVPKNSTFNTDRYRTIQNYGIGNIRVIQYIIDNEHLMTNIVCERIEGSEDIKVYFEQSEYAKRKESIENSKVGKILEEIENE